MKSHVLPSSPESASDSSQTWALGALGGGVIRINYLDGKPAPVFSSFDLAKEHSMEVTVRRGLVCFPKLVTPEFDIPTLLIE